MHCMMNCTLHRLECPHLSNAPASGDPALFGAGQVGTDMRTLFAAVHLAAPVASVHSFPVKTDEQSGGTAIA
jgi:hypothetical protein